MKQYLVFVYKDLESDYGVFFLDVFGCFIVGIMFEDVMVMGVKVLCFYFDEFLDFGQVVLEVCLFDNIIVSYEFLEDLENVIFVLIVFVFRMGKIVCINLLIDEFVLKCIDVKVCQVGMNWF